MKYTTNFFLLNFLLAFLLIGCNKPRDLSKQFSCENTSQLQNLESVDDFNKNFTVKLPKHWKTKLYYDSIQSEIFSADTIKNLLDTYIMDFAIVNSTIQLTENLSKKVHQKSMDNNMKTEKESFHKFKGNEAYAHLGVGSSRGETFHIFQYYIKTSEDQYMLIKIEFYGDKNFETRFCEAISLIDKLEINK
jgi:hypothetical protein